MSYMGLVSSSSGLSCWSLSATGGFIREIPCIENSILCCNYVSELQTLSIREPFLTNFEDREVLRRDPGFLPKVASSFHRPQDIVLATFCNFPRSEKEKSFSFLDVRRILHFYLEVTKNFRKSDALFLRGPRE